MKVKNMKVLPLGVLLIPLVTHGLGGDDSASGFWPLPSILHMAIMIVMVQYSTQNKPGVPYS